MLRSCLAAAVGVLIIPAGPIGSAAGNPTEGSAPTAAVGQSDVDRYELDRARKVRRDRTLRTLSEGVLRMRKLTYRSRIGDLDIPFYLFEPLELRRDRGQVAPGYVL